MSNESGGTQSKKSRQPTKEKLAISQSQGPSLWKPCPPEIRTDPLLLFWENISIILLCPPFPPTSGGGYQIAFSDELHWRSSSVTTCFFSPVFSKDSGLGLKSWNWISFSAAHDDTDPLNSEPFLSIEAAGPVCSVLIEFSYFLWDFCVFTLQYCKAQGFPYAVTSLPHAWWSVALCILEQRHDNANKGNKMNCGLARCSEKVKRLIATSSSRVWIWLRPLHLGDLSSVVLFCIRLRLMCSYIQKNWVKNGNTPLTGWHHFNQSRCQQPKKDPLVHHNFLVLCSLPTNRLDVFNRAMYR